VSVGVVPRDGAQAAASEGRSADPEPGTVQLIDNQIDQTTGTVRLKAVFANTRQRLWPGEFINARVLVRTVHHALTVPAVALQRGPDGLFAYVIGPDLRVEAHQVQVGYSDEDVAVIEGGLTEGERVATSNFYRLQPGAVVQINRTTQAQQPEQAAGPERASSRRPT